MTKPDKPPKEVPIQIDRKHFKVQNPVAGSHLYELGGIAADYELYEESKGDADDRLIENSAKQYNMEPGDKLYSAPKSLNPGR